MLRILKNIIGSFLLGLIISSGVIYYFDEEASFSYLDETFNQIKKVSFNWRKDEEEIKQPLILGEENEEEALVGGHKNDSRSSNFIGPRQNISEKAPKDYGFWSLALLENKKISRSGQPTLSEFQWLKENGWKSIINLRTEWEYQEVADDQKIPGFKNLDFNYLSIAIKDGSPPTEEQAKEFLSFVSEPKNQPVHVHCRGGYGRTGTMVALYRYQIDGWSMEDAIEEAKLFREGVSLVQENWLKEWEKKYESGQKIY